MNQAISTTAQRLPGGLPGLGRTAADTLAAFRLWWQIHCQSRRQQLKATRPNLLIVSWAFAPVHQTSAHFPKALVRAASKLGLSYSVLCSSAPAAPTPQGLEMFRDLPPDAVPHRVEYPVDAVNNPLLGPKLWGFPALDGQFTTALLMAQKGMRRLAADPPATTLAFGPRFANFVAASYLARWSGARLALFYIDEWTVQTPPFVKVGDHDRRWEQRCLQQADTVFFVTEGKRRAYLAQFLFLTDKRVTVFENGWDPRPFEKVSTPPVSPLQGRLMIDFVGVAATHTPIARFFDTLARCFDVRPNLRERVVVRLTGTRTAYADACVAQARANGIAVNVEAAIPQSAAVERMMASHALLLLLNTQYGGLIPQKTYDYLRCGSPILAFGTTSEGAAFVKACGAGPVVADGDALALAQALDRLLTAERATWNTPARRAWVASRNRETIATDLLNALTFAQHDTAHRP